MAEKLLPYVVRELQARKGDWPKISADTELDYSWLTKLAQGRIPDPGVNKIEKLAEYFKDRRRTKAQEARA
jgi:hypothetical protein